MAASPRRLHGFDGGITLPPQRSATERPLATVPLPDELILPLHQHLGAPARPVVKAGWLVLRGQALAEADGYVSASIHASTSGRVVAIEDRAVPHPGGGIAPCVVLEPDGEDRAPDEPQLPAIPDFHHVSPADIRARVRDAGIVGLGGAAFPTAVKLTARADTLLELLILNCAECEPYISCDETLLCERTASVVAGAQIMLHALQVNRCLVAVEADKRAAIEALEKRLAEVGDDRLELVEVPVRYPEGGERQLIQVLTGKEVPFEGLPMDVGCVCQNAGTAAAVADAVLLGDPLISRIVTVTGSGIREPLNVEARIGTPIADLVRTAGGYEDGAQRLMMGGAMMGYALDSDALPILKGTNCILALTANELRQPGDAMPCIRCGECARVCPARLLPQQMHWHIQADRLDRARAQHVFDCIECGCCDVVCPSHIPLAESFRTAKHELWLGDQVQQARALARERFVSRERRLTREQQARDARRAQRRIARDTTPESDPPTASAPGQAAAREDDRKRVVREAVERANARRSNRPTPPSK